MYGLGSEHFDYFQPKLIYVGWENFNPTQLNGSLKTNPACKNQINWIVAPKL